MKAARRQELRTNELSQQLDKLGDTFKRNSTTLTAVIVGAVLIVLASYWYSNRKAGAVDSAVAQSSYDAEKDDIRAFIDRCQSVANEQVTPEVTRMAWLRIGSSALGEMMTPKNPTGETTPAPKMSREELATTAKDAFNRVVLLAGDDRNSRAGALFALGLLDENTGNFSSARERYTDLKGDTSLADTPFITQAEFRLSQLDNWAKPVVFAVPPPLPPAPDPMSISPVPETSTFKPPVTTISQPPSPASSTPPAGSPPAATTATPPPVIPAPTPTSSPTP